MTTETPRCCVCEDSNTIVESVYSKCPSNHIICRNCFLSILQMCYCTGNVGQLIYKCPLCRNEHNVSNSDMNEMLINFNGVSDMCVRVHGKCENNNMVKRCQFDKCGCRTNIVDIITRAQVDLAIKEIVFVANKYPKSPKSQTSLISEFSKFSHG